MALELDADVIGINNRDLADFSVDLERTYELLADVPAGKTVVSESGIATREQIEELERVGVDAVLVGETLMRADDPEAATRELTAFEEPDAGVEAAASGFPTIEPMATLPELDPPAVAELGARLARQRGAGGEGARPGGARRAGEPPVRGPRADRGLPGRGQDRAGACPGRLDRGRVRARAVHRGPAARRHHGHQRLQPAREPLRVPARAGVRQRGAGRRDQPRLSEDAVGPARVHAGAARERGQAHPPARPALHRARHPEPDRVRGHLPAARGAARPLHGAGLARATRRPTTRPRCWPSTRRATASRTWSRSPTSATCWPPRLPPAACTGARRCAATWWPCWRRPGPIRAWSSAPRRAPA